MESTPSFGTASVQKKTGQPHVHESTTLNVESRKVVEAGKVMESWSEGIREIIRLKTYVVKASNHRNSGPVRPKGTSSALWNKTEGDQLWSGAAPLRGDRMDGAIPRSTRKRHRSARATHHNGPAH
jgi:hypothetical protein